MIHVRLLLRVERNGEVVVEREAHSWVKNFIIMLYGCMEADLRTGAPSVTKTNGETQSLQITGARSAIRIAWAGAGAGQAGHGIVVGSGTTPPKPSDYKLESQIGTEELSYGNVTITSPECEENKCSFKIVRSFTALKDGITVSEVGIYALFENGNYATFTYMVARDVLETPVKLNSGDTMTVTYTVEITT